MHSHYRAIVGRIPRNATIENLEPIAEELAALADELLKALEGHVKAEILDANAAQDERHIHNSNPKPPN